MPGGAEARAVRCRCSGATFSEVLCIHDPFVYPIVRFLITDMRFATALVGNYWRNSNLFPGHARLWFGYDTDYTTFEKALRSLACEQASSSHPVTNSCIDYRSSDAHRRRDPDRSEGTRVYSILNPRGGNKILRMTPMG